MAMLAFSHFEKSKNQFQLIQHIIHDLTLVINKKREPVFQVPN
jgi:hypothetical protein